MFTFNIDGKRQANRFEDQNLMIGTPSFGHNSNRHAGVIVREAWWEHKDSLLADFIKRIGTFSKLKQWPASTRAKDRKISVMCVHARNFVAAVNFVCSAKTRNLDIKSLVIFTCSYHIAEAFRAMKVSTIHDKGVCRVPLRARRSRTGGKKKFAELQLAWLRLASVWMSLETGAHVLYQEPSFIWKNDPWANIQEEYWQPNFEEHKRRIQRSGVTVRISSGKRRTPTMATLDEAKQYCSSFLDKEPKKSDPDPFHPDDTGGYCAGFILQVPAGGLKAGTRTRVEFVLEWDKNLATDTEEKGNWHTFVLTPPKMTFWMDSARRSSAIAPFYASDTFFVLRQNAAVQVDVLHEIIRLY